MAIRDDKLALTILRLSLAWLIFCTGVGVLAVSIKFLGVI